MLITSICHNIKTFDCGPDSKMRLHNLMLLFQEAAHISAEKLGFGYSELLRTNRAWVLSNIKLNLLRYPEWLEDIIINTWPSGYNRLSAYRDFSVESKNGARYINATSDWLAIDLKSRRPINMNDWLVPIPDTGLRAIDEQLVRLNPRRLGEGIKIGEITVPHSSIDQNGHVNNTEYVRWCLDLVKKENIIPGNISSIQVSFLSELLENEELEFFYLQKGEMNYLYGRKMKSKEFVFCLQIFSTL